MKVLPVLDESIQTKRRASKQMDKIIHDEELDKYKT